MMWYFEYSEVKRRMVVHIVDSVVGIMEFDKQMIEYLSKLGIDFVIVANKIDKLSYQERKKHIEEIQKECKEHQIIPYSAVTNEGRAALLTAIEKTMI